jgi:hypothetical protein
MSFNSVVFYVFLAKSLRSFRSFTVLLYVLSLIAKSARGRALVAEKQIEEPCLETLLTMSFFLYYFNCDTLTIPPLLAVSLRERLCACRPHNIIMPEKERRRRATFLVAFYDHDTALFRGV